MTVQEMADKYGISYSTAFKCTYGIKPVAYRDKNRCNQYREKELVEHLISMIMGKQAIAAKRIQQLDKRIEEVKRIARSL